MILAAHSHGPSASDFGDSFARSGHRRRLRLVLVVTAVALVLEITGGILARSLALLADAAHLFADIAALILAYAAMSLASRAPTRRHSFGFYRAEILAAFVNAQVLLVLSVLILFDAFQRLQSPVEVRAGLMLWVALIGLVANCVSLRVLAPARKTSLNLRAAHLEVVSDLLGSVAVITAAVLIPITRWHWLDPAVSACVAALILPRAVSLLRQSAHILLEGTPGEIDVPGLRQRILEIPGVEAIHDLHFWTLTSGLHSASVHIRASEDRPRGEILRGVQEMLEREAGVAHATIQVERGAEISCHMSNRGHA